MQTIKRLFPPGLKRLSHRAAASRCRRRAEILRNTSDPPPRPDKILAVKLYGIGNMILFVPALAALKSLYPDAGICLLTDGRRNTDLLEGSGLFDRRFIYRRERGLDLDLIRQLRRENFSAALFSYPLNEDDIALTVSLAKVPCLIGPDESAARPYFTHPVDTGPWPHEVEKNIHLLDILGGVKTYREPRIFLKPEEEEQADRRIEKAAARRPAVGFHPGSFPDMTAKRWPASRYAALGDRLSEEADAAVLLFGSREERAMSDDIAGRMRAPCHVFTGELSLRESAALIGSCDLFISNDSGLMHVAAALSTPVIGLFGPTSPEKNAPRGPGRRVVIQAGEACAPCYRFKKIECDDYLCMTGISVDRVYGEAVKILSDIRSGSIETGREEVRQ
jgi:heptosyltransferase-2